MNKKEFSQLQNQAGVPANQCPQCTSTAIRNMECEDCGTNFKQWTTSKSNAAIRLKKRVQK